MYYEFKYTSYEFKSKSWVQIHELENKKHELED